MTRPRLRLRALVVVATALTLVGAFMFAAWAALGATQTESVSPEVVLAARRLAIEAIAVGTVAALAFGLLLAYGLGSLLTAELGALRRAALERARGARPSVPESRLREMHAAATAVEMLAKELENRAAVLESERTRLDALLQAVNEGILHVGVDGRLRRANPAARALLGIPDTATGAPVSSLVREAELRELLRRAAAGETIAGRELTLDDRTLFVSARPLPGGGTVVSVADLTELRRLESVRRDFVANASHELKTPLTSIRGYAETLHADDLPPEVQRQFIDVIQTNAERLQRIVDELLDLSRIESGGWKPELHEIEAATAAEDAWAACRLAADRKRLLFTVSGAGLVNADPGGLRQILANLFDNAIRHTPEGGRIAVRIARMPDDRIEIAVRDTGTGIPRDALPRIFERFYRVDPARSRAEGGTGLGLSIVRHLTESMDGEVSAESELGKGTTIRVRLPASAAPGATGYGGVTATPRAS